jgi:hypothetical protein
MTSILMFQWISNGKNVPKNGWLPVTIELKGVMGDLQMYIGFQGVWLCGMAFTLCRIYAI